jgi:hypothetical protein
MQTFLPSDSFFESAKVLDNKRLNKQLIEVHGILEALHGGNGWIHHPIVRMWRGYVDSLVEYGVAIALECSQRGIKYDTISKILRFGKTTGARPNWIGNKEFHSSHRSNLLRKGRADAVCERIRRQFKKPINPWLKYNGFSQKNQLSLEEIRQLESFANRWDYPMIENHYKQFNWKESDNLPYIWPKI